MFNDSDIIDLIFKLNEDGYYDLNKRVIKYKRSKSNMNYYVSVHENLHEYLNSVTIFGGILNTYAYIFQNTELDIYKHIISELIKRCRSNHEVYATFIAALNSSDHNSEVFIESVLIGISENPTYKNYFLTGNYISSYFKSWFFKEIAVSVTIYACMQNLNLFKEIQKKGLENFNPIKIPVKYYPDEILRKSLPYLGEDFWRDKFELFKNKFNSERSFDELLKLEKKENSEMVKFDINNIDVGIINTVQKFFYSELILHLRNKIGSEFTIADIDAHITISKKLLKAAYEIIPIEKAKFPRVAFSDSNIEYSEAFSRQVENEEIYFGNKRFHAVTAYLSAIDQNQWELFNCGNEKTKHFFLIFRTVQELKEQYLFFEDDLSRLKQYENTGLYCIRRLLSIKTEKDQLVRYIELIIVDNYNTMETFLNRFFKKQRIICNVSYRANLITNSVHSNWKLLIKKYTKYTFILNVSLIEFYKNISKRGKDSRSFNSIDYYLVKLGEANYPAFVLFDSVEDQIYICPCSASISTGFIIFLKSVNDKLFRKKPDFLYGKSQFTIISTFTHLFTEEFLFNFSVYGNINYKN